LDLSEVVQEKDSNENNNTQTAVKGSLLIQLLTNQGNPDMYVSCEPLPTQLAAYQWKSTSYGLETLALSHEVL
jgi:hypothetical protein